MRPAADAFSPSENCWSPGVAFCGSPAAWLILLYVPHEVCKGVDCMDPVEVNMTQSSTILFFHQLHACDVLCVVMLSCSSHVGARAATYLPN